MQPGGGLEQSLRSAPALAPASYLGDDRSARAISCTACTIARSHRSGAVGLVDLTGRRRLLDVGGGPGTYAALFARRYPDCAPP
jgi:hypothetical protein